MAIPRPWPLCFLCVLALILPHVHANASWCQDKTSERDSGGDSCSFYEGQSHLCGCCDTQLFSASDCCACQQTHTQIQGVDANADSDTGADTSSDTNTTNTNTTNTTNTTTNTSSSWWALVLQNWPAKATALRLPNKGIQAELPNDLADRWPHLVEIDLSQNRLTGKVPGDIGRLANLSCLDLSGNGLSGRLPTAIGSLSQLRYLLLGSNNLEGKILEEIADLANLERLDLSANEFTDKLPKLGTLPRLQRLYVNDNRISGGIPDELGELERLEHLQLHGNAFGGGIPKELGKLRSLQSLSLHSNLLRGKLPEELGSLQSLRILYANNNALQGSLPEVLGNLTSLQRLYLHSNSFSGSLPPELGQLQSLQRLYLHSNSLSGSLPPQLGQLPSLQRLYLDSNAFTGRLPRSLGNLTSLQSLNLGSNQFSGWLPKELGNLVNLQELHAGDNKLSGGLPRTLSGLRSLQILSLRSNQFSGKLPEELGYLGSLLHLSLEGNNFEGRLPADLGNLTSLQQLHLSNNRFAGGVPGVLGDLENLQTLELNNNLLTGSLSPKLGSLHSLQVLNLRNNQLVGSLPAQLGKLGALQVLQLDNNELSGILPRSIGKLSSLKYLYLHNNLITGSIPAELGWLKSLQRLSLYNNRLHGDLPMELGNLSSLQELDLFNNQFTGPLPTEFGKLSSLLRLRLQKNQLNGSLPAELGNLTGLETLSLHSNHFTGQIPSELGRMSMLRELHLQHNQLEGSLPPALGDLTLLQALNMQNNLLSGDLPSSFASLQQLQVLRAAENTLLCGGGQVLRELSSLARLELRNCCFQDVPELPTNLEYLDLGGNRLEKVPKRWQEQGLQLLKTLLLDGNHIAHWDTSAIVPLSYRLENSWLCGYKPPGQRFVWPLLERLEVSSNPLSVPVYDFLESLSHLTWLSVLEARDANLTGDVPFVYWAKLVPGAPHTGDTDCTGLTSPADSVSFPALLTLDLAGNGITAVQSMPPRQLAQVDLSRNALTALNPLWLSSSTRGDNAGNAALQRLDARANPALHLPVRLNATGSCPLLGATELTADPQGWSTAEDGRSECTSLCPMDANQVLLDATVNESVMCRCAYGHGIGLACSACPGNAFSSLSFQSGHYTRSCLGCPKNSNLQAGDTHGQGMCFADCDCTEGYFMVQIHQGRGGSHDIQETLGVSGAPCAGLSSEAEGRCESCGLFKTSAPGSRKGSDCFCNTVIGHPDVQECLSQEDCSDWTRSLEPPTVKEGFWALPPPLRGRDGTFSNFSRHIIWVCQSTSACPGAVAAVCLFSAGMGTDPDLPYLGGHIEGGHEGSDYFVRAISLACLQGLSLVAPVTILTFQVLMAFERSRRLVPRCLQPMSEQEREEWSQTFATHMGVQGSALPEAVAKLDSYDFYAFQRSVSTAVEARASLGSLGSLASVQSCSSSSLGVGSTCTGGSWGFSGLQHSRAAYEDDPALHHRSKSVEEVAALVPGLREEIAALKAEIADLRLKDKVPRAGGSDEEEVEEVEDTTTDLEIDRRGSLVSTSTGATHFKTLMTTMSL